MNTLAETHPEKIEVTPFIRWDIRDSINDVTRHKLPERDVDKCVNEIMDKVIDFVNQNYNPKP